MSIKSKKCVAFNFTSGEFKAFESQYKAANYYEVQYTNVSKAIERHEDSLDNGAASFYTDKGIVTFYATKPSEDIILKSQVMEIEGRKPISAPYSRKSFDYLLSRIGATREDIENEYKPHLERQILIIKGHRVTLLNTMYKYTT
jgi:hypothetical protein